MMFRRGIFVAAASVAGCSVLPKRPYEERRQWPLEASRPQTLPPDPRGKILLVRDLRAGPGLQSRGLRTLGADGSVRADPWEEWAVPPADGVEASLAAWLEASGLFSAVIGPGSRLVPDLVVEGELNALIAEPASGRSRIVLSLVVLAENAGRSRPLLQQRFAGEAPLAGDTGPVIAASTGEALGRLLAQVETALGGLARR